MVRSSRILNSYIPLTLFFLYSTILSSLSTSLTVIPTGSVAFPSRPLFPSSTANPLGLLGPFSLECCVAPLWRRQREGLAPSMATLAVLTPFGAWSGDQLPCRAFSLGNH